mmetsp:Transcript_7827/g.9060  ORF Transcript_7827/g.9060 Transcript_7827/m.9060 type:complete len:81 (-) Transcript_7827:501-743(-)
MGRLSSHLRHFSLFSDFTFNVDFISFVPSFLACEREMSLSYEEKSFWSERDEVSRLASESQSASQRKRTVGRISKMYFVN